MTASGLGKVVLGLLATLVALVAILLGVVFTLNPNDYKSDIQKAVSDAAGYQVVLEGDLGWSLYPVLGVKAGSVSVALNASSPRLLAVEQVNVGLQLLPLLEKKIQADSLVFSGVQLDLVVDSTGANNWQQPNVDSKTKPTIEESKTTGEFSAPQLQINAIDLKKIHIRYVDEGAAAEQAVQIDYVQLNNVGFDQPVDMTLALQWQDQSGSQVSASGSGVLQVNSALTEVAIASLNLQADLAGFTERPIASKLSLSGKANLAEDLLALTLHSLSAANASLNSTINVKGLTGSPVVSASVAVPEFNAKTLMGNLGVAAPEMAGDDALSAVALTARLNSDLNNLKVDAIDFRLDQTRIQGDASVVNLAKPGYRFNVRMDQIVLDDYLPVNEAPVEQPKKTEPTGKDKQVIPVALIRELNVVGKAKIDKFTYQKTPVQNATVAVTARDGVLTLTDIHANVMQGSVDGSVSVDARKQEPKVTTDLRINALELSELANLFLDQQLISGKTSFDLNTSTSGNDIDTLVNAAIGQMNLQVVEGILHGINLNSIVVDALHDEVGNFETFFPNYASQLPKELKENTDISELFANAKIEQGKLIMPEFKFASESGQIQAKGDIHLLTQAFDYEFAVHLTEIDRNKYLKNTLWPVRCKGDFSVPVAQWCKPDSKQVNRIISKAAKMALKDKSAKELIDKVGLEAETQEQMEDELKQKLKAEEDRAKRRLKEKLDKWLK